MEAITQFYVSSQAQLAGTNTTVTPLNCIEITLL